MARRLQPKAGVTAVAIHRIVEQRAAAGPERIAVVDGSDSLTYRDLNHRANAVARHLMAHGFRRGAHATVRMRRGTSLDVQVLQESRDKALHGTSRTRGEAVE